MLERRLSELVGEQTWRKPVLGVALDIELNQRIASLEAGVADARTRHAE